MAIKRTDIEGTRIVCEIESSNLVKTEYDTESKKLITTFKNGLRYEYEDDLCNDYLNGESQTFLAKKYKIGFERNFLEPPQTRRHNLVRKPFPRLLEFRSLIVQSLPNFWVHLAYDLYASLVFPHCNRRRYI